MSEFTGPGPQRLTEEGRAYIRASEHTELGRYLTIMLLESPPCPEIAAALIKWSEAYCLEQAAAGGRDGAASLVERALKMQRLATSARFWDMVAIDRGLLVAP